MRGVRVRVLGNGAAGAEKQAMALGRRIREKLLEKASLGMRCPPVERVSVALGSSRLLPPVLQILGARVTRNPLFGYKEEDARRLLAVQKDQDELDVVIGCGRSTVALCAVLKQLQPKTTFNVQVQHPRVPLTWFDAVVVPHHDFPRGAGGTGKVFLTSGTVHDITPGLLQQHGKEWGEELDEKLCGRRRRVVWLLGGPCRGFAFTEKEAERMVKGFVDALPQDEEVAVLVTFSRRTPRNVQHIIRRGLQSRLSKPGQLLMWEGTESRNPYYALLSTATCIVTTPDSISMTTEAIASGKPVLTISVEHSKGKFQRFHQSLFSSNATAPFTKDTLATALQDGLASKGNSSSAASVVLENELGAIVDCITEDIHAVLKNFN